MVVGRWIECRGDLFADGAKSLKLRLRDRFRVAAVDYHRHRYFRIAGGGYFSSTVQWWLDRLSDFRRGSLPSSSTFYRKRGICCICVQILPVVDRPSFAVVRNQKLFFAEKPAVRQAYLSFVPNKGDELLYRKERVPKLGRLVGHGGRAQ